MITNLCSTDALTRLWKQIRYELIPNNYLRIIEIVIRKTRDKYLVHGLLLIVVDWFGAGYPAMAKKTSDEEMLQVLIDPNVKLDLKSEDFMVT